VGNAVIAAPSPAPLTTDHTFTVKIHNEPISLAVAPTDDGRIILRVVPWQQQWSHSLTIAIVLGMLAGIVWGVPAGLVAGGAYALHLVTDQLGFTGSNLFFPFTRHRASGFQILHPGQATVFYIGVAWLAMLLTGWNWARTVLMLNPLPALIPTLLFAGALPMAGIVWLIKRTRMIH